MTALLLLYWPTILAATATAAALAFLGALVITRQAAVQTLAVSQGAGFGVSLGLLANQVYFHEAHLEHTVLPLATGLVASALAFGATERASRLSPTPTAVYLGAFALLWSGTQLLTGFFPVIESHATALYFGDVVTLTRSESFFFLALAVAALAYLGRSWRRQAERAFLAAILEEPLSFKSGRDRGFQVVALLMVCLSVQLLGLLFTLAALFLPTTVYSFARAPGAGRHLLRVAVAAALAAAGGFILSLVDGRFLTTPAIAFLLALVPALHLVAARFFPASKLHLGYTGRR